MEKRIGELLPRPPKKIVRMPPDFDEVQLTEEETEYAIWDARCDKYFDLKKQQEMDLQRKAIQDAGKPFTAKQLGEYILEINPHFKVDDSCRDLFLLLCQYFTNDPDFEKSGHKLSKGLLLSGPVGVGKTELLRIFQKNKRQSYYLTSVFEIEKHCQEQGVERFTTFTGFVPGWGGKEKYFYQPNIGWAFDDIGRESVVFDFGNKSDVVSKIIQVRYLNKDKIPFNSLHLTTNLTPDEIENRYDYAVKSRLREMFNYIQIKGFDRRK
jgi:hypothetical protein